MVRDDLFLMIGENRTFLLIAGNYDLYTLFKVCLISSASCVIEKDAFFDCGSLVLYCPYSSLATVYAIDHEIPFESSGVMTDSDSFALDHTSGTGLYADLNSMTANGCVTLTLNYSVKEQWTSRVSDLSAHIRLPSCVELDEDTIKLDGAYCKDYELDETMLTVPLSNTSGTIKMSVRIVKQGKITCYAVMELYKDDELA